MEKIFIFLSILIFISGCVQQVGDGMALRLQADPPSVFSESTTTLHIDIENKDTKTLENVVVDVFDTGILKPLQVCDWSGCRNEPCRKSYFGRQGNKFMPRQFETFSCILQAPKIEQTSLTTDINVKASFSTGFSAVQLVEMMTEEEYNNRVASRNFRQLPKSYSYRDKYIQLDIEFSEPLPIVVREGKKYFIYFTIRNIGNGFVGAIEPDKFYFKQEGDLIKCFGSGKENTYLIGDMLEPIGKSFPRLACEIFMPSNIKYLANYQLTIQLGYDYEIRESTSVKIIR